MESPITSSTPFLIKPEIINSKTTDLEKLDRLSRISLKAEKRNANDIKKILNIRMLWKTIKSKHNEEAQFCEEERRWLGNSNPRCQNCTK